MASTPSEQVLLLLDFINEIVSAEGKLSGKGYTAFDAKHGSLDRVSQLLQWARGNGMAVVHVRVQFADDYKEQPEASPLFGAAKKFGALRAGTWATEFHAKAAPVAGEAVIAKHRVSAFFGTPLELVLRQYGAKRVLVAGCATDMAVQAAARDLHDRDFAAVVVGDCCIAASDEDHEHALRLMSKVASVTSLTDVRAS